MNNRRNIKHNALYLHLFGVGVSLRDDYQQLLLSLDCKPDFLFDNEPEKWGREY